MEQIGIAIIGAGNIAQNFHLPALCKSKDFKVIAINDKIKSNAKYIASKYNIPYVCSNVEEVLDIDAIEAIDICTTTDAHHEIAIAAMEKGKAVFIEKPLARSFEEAKAISDAQKKYNAKAMVGMNQRFRYDAKMMKQYIHQGEAGKLFYAKAGWQQRKHGKQWRQEINKSGGGVLIDLGISVIDSLLWFFNFEKVRAVNAATFNHLTKSVEDVCTGSIYFENGSVATFEVSWTLFSSINNFYFDIHGSDGSIKLNPIQLFKSTGSRHEPIKSEEKSNLKMFLDSYKAELKHFSYVVRDLAPVISTIDEAVETMRVVDALYRSAKEKREIYLD